MHRQLLIIDDDRAIHTLVNVHLANLKTRCISALDGVEGIRRACDERPGAILLDMDIPHMNGMEVCRRLKANPQTSEIPVMFLTSDITIKSKVQGIEMGACDYLTKPFDPHELRARVGSAFRAADALHLVNTLAAVDKATGLWNRAFLFKQIERTIAAAARSRQMVTCCFVSLDRFDELAEKTGQSGGADLIREAAELISSAVRLEDIVCRYDTRIFAVLGLTPDWKVGQILAERLRSCVGAIGLRSFVEAETVTCSVGLAMARATAGPALLRVASEALSKAQLHGNRVVSSNADQSEHAQHAIFFN